MSGSLRCQSDDDAGVATPASWTAEPAEQLDPRRAVVDEQAERGANMKSDDEGEEERFGLRLGVDEVVPTEQGRQQHAVAEARDREELGDALRQTHEIAWKYVREACTPSTLNDRDRGDGDGFRSEFSGAVSHGGATREVLTGQAGRVGLRRTLNKRGRDECERLRAWASDAE